MGAVAMHSIQKITKTSAWGEAAVACARLESSQAAIAMLEAGGNAVDAAVAAAFVAGVIEPMETTLAGSGFLLMHRPGQAQALAVEFAARAPLAARPDMFRIDTGRSVDRGLGVSVVEGDANIRGALAAGVPATIRGLVDAQTAHGRLPLAQVMQPAIEAAHDGFEADNYYALEVLAHVEGLRVDPGASAVFLRDGLPPAPAHLGTASLGAPARIVQHNLGRALEQIAHGGAEAFYTGDVGAALVASVAELGGILSADDLAACRSASVPARTIRFRGADVWVPQAPCGALTQLQMLTLWERLCGGRVHARDSLERTRLLCAVSRHAFADRYHWLGDPQGVAVPEQALLSSAYADQVVAEIREHGVPTWKEHGQAPWDHFARHRPRDAWRFDPSGNAPPPWAPQGSTEAPSGTTHVSVIDRDGMAVSITHTAANHFGASTVCPRTGLLLDAAMGWFNAVPGAANSIAPGKRPLANMAPMLLTRDGEAVAALGAPGGRRIISAIAQIAIDLLERGHDAAEAVHAPRLDASGKVVLLSERMADIAQALEAEGVDTRLVSEQHEGFGYELARPNIVVRHGAGRNEAACDPFSKGFAVAVAPVAAG